MKLLAVAGSILHLVAAPGLAAAASPSPDALPGAITVTMVIVTGNLATIRGTNFGDAAPSVVLGGHPLTVVGSNREEVLAEVPDGLAPGTYLLVVSRIANRRPFTLFDVTIGAAGPQGEKGEVGPPGPPGPPGPDVTAQITELRSRVDSLTAQVGTLSTQVVSQQSLLQHFRRAGNDVFIEGANLHVRSGSGATNGPVNGLGNLIVGYDETGDGGALRGGSHNLVVGREHNYSSYGGVVAGLRGTVSAPYSVSFTGGSFIVNSTTIDMFASSSARLRANGPIDVLAATALTIKGSTVNIN